MRGRDSRKMALLIEFYMEGEKGKDWGKRWTMALGMHAAQNLSSYCRGKQGN